MIVDGDTDRPFETILNAGPEDVELVLVDGDPIYGKVAWLDALGKGRDYEELDVCGATMGIDVTAGGASWFDRQRRFVRVRERLRDGMATVRAADDLAPIAECR